MKQNIVAIGVNKEAVSSYRMHFQTEFITATVFGWRTIFLKSFCIKVNCHNYYKCAPLFI